MLQTAQIKHPDTPIRTAAHEDIDTICTKPYIVHFLVVRNELRFSCESRYVPDRTRRVNAGGDNEARRYSIPVQRRDRRSMFR